MFWMPFLNSSICCVCLIVKQKFFFHLIKRLLFLFEFAFILQFSSLCSINRNGNGSLKAGANRICRRTRYSHRFLVKTSINSFKMQSASSVVIFVNFCLSKALLCSWLWISYRVGWMIEPTCDRVGISNSMGGSMTDKIDSLTPFFVRTILTQSNFVSVWLGTSIEKLLKIRAPINKKFKRKKPKTKNKCSRKWKKFSF